MVENTQRESSARSDSHGNRKADDYTDAEKALNHTVLAARRFIELGQHDTAAVIMQAGSSGYEQYTLSSAQTTVSE